MAAPDDGLRDHDRLQQRLQSMDDFDFEHLIADLWEAQGWNASVEQQSGDAGVDVRATKSVPYEQKTLIQAKRYSEDNTLGGPDIQQYAALKQQEANVDKAIVITTGRFTSAAEDRAVDLNVKLIDGEELVELIERLDAYDLVDEYLEPAAPSAGGGSGSTASGGQELYVPPAKRKALENVIGDDYEQHLKEERYQATRAVERGRAMIKLNPHDAAELGVFDAVEEVDEIDPERNWADAKEVLPLVVEDIHRDQNDDIFVADITDYVDAAAIPSDHNEHIIGHLERGVGDENWVKDSAGAKRLVKKAKQPGEHKGPLARLGEFLSGGYSNFHYFSAGGFGLAVLGLILAGSGGEQFTVISGIGALLALTMPLVGLVGVFFDLIYIRNQDIEWKPSLVLGLAGAMLAAVVYVPYYLYRRKQSIGL